MDLIKKLFSFNNDETSAIGLCKFNDDFLRTMEAKEQIKKRSSRKEQTITEMLKRTY